MKRFALKRITALALALIMVFSLCPVRAEAAAFVSLLGNSAVQAGTDVTLTLKISGTNIMGIEATLDYDKKILEYRSYRGIADGWDIVPSGEEFVMYGVRNPINEPTNVVSLTFRVKEDVSVGTALDVSFQNVVVSNGESDLVVGTAVWSGTVMTPAQNVTPIAYIDGVPNVKYIALQAAVDAAEDGDVIKMLSDYVLEDELEIDKIYSENGYYEIISKDISFDLCGYTFNLKGGTITGGFDFENGCLNVSDNACVTYGDIKTQSGVVNIKGGEIDGLNISGEGSCSIWAGSFPGLWNDAVLPYLVSETPFYRIDVTASPTVAGANWPIEVPPMFWLTTTVSGGDSVITHDGCFVECKTGVAATFNSTSGNSEYYESYISGCGYSGLASGDNLVTVSQENGVTTFTMCPKDTYSGVLPVGGNINVKYRAIPHAITAAVDENGSVDIPANAIADELVTITTAPNDGYEVASIAITKTADGTDITDSVNLIGSPNTYTFVMSNEPVTVKVSFVEISSGDDNEARWGLATGENSDELPTSWTSGTLVDAMTYANSLASGTAYIQLCSDVDTFAPLEFASEKNTILDLNGYDIDRGLTQAVDGGNVITVNGNLTLCDTSENAATAPGKITGGYGYYDVGGVLVKDGGTLNITGGAIADNRSEKGTGGMMVDGRGTVNMSGGTIIGNKGWQAGGVFLSGGGIMTDNGLEVICGVLNMSGGSIIGNERNTDNEYGAGGISVICEDSLFLSGSASITGNVKHCGYPSNIWLKGNSVIITGELSGAFGIGKEYEEFDHPSSYLVAEGTDDYAITAEDRAKLTSDNGHDILLNNRENHLMLAPGAYAVSFNLQGMEGTVDSQTIFYGEKVMRPDSPTSEDYAFLGWYKEPACKNIWNFDTDIVTKTTVLYAKWGEKTDKDGLWCEDIAPQIYTGSAIKPMVRVYYRDKLLTEKIDYTLSYKNNTNAADCDSTKAPTITIKGKGNFSGTLTKTFTILPADIGSNLPIEEIYAAANDRGQKPKITITIGTKKLDTKDMTVTYYNAEEGFWTPGDCVESCVGEGTWAIVASGQGNYTGERTYLFHAVGAGKLISKAKLSLSAKSITYDGNWHTPEVKVMIGKTELTEGEHYSVSYRDNHGVGTATVTVTGINGYVGTATTTFKITGIPMSKMKVEFLNKATGEYSTKAPSYTYTGAPIKMYEDMGDFRVYYDAKVDGETTRINLSPLEYAVSYQNNDCKGTATMLLTGKEAWGFTGTLKKTFKIDAYDILKDIENSIEVEENIVASYLKGGAKPVPVITFNGEPLVAGVDYTLAYKNNMAVADADSAKAPMITITGKGNFVGKVTVNFSIEAKALSEVDVLVDDKAYTPKATGLPTVTLTDTDGKKLAAGKDYDKLVSYTYTEDVTLENGVSRNAGDAVDKKDIIPVGTVIRVTVVGNGTTYTGETSTTYRIVPQSLAKATVKVANQQYTGKPIVPNKDDITVTVNKVKVDPENFEIVSCTNNVNKGSATLTIRGVGDNYGGVKTVKFKIDAKAMAWSNLQSTLFDLFS